MPRFLGLAAAGLRLLLQRSLPRIQGKLTLPGLRGEVEVLRDQWGVPHIYAGCNHDLFFAQGYVQAQDRLWQMELSRRLASGALAEVFGDSLLEVDRFQRRLGFRRVAEASLHLLPQEVREATEALCAGVNAFVARQGRALAPEFLLLRTRPRPWRLVDSLAVGRHLAFALSGNWQMELVRGHLIARFGPERAAQLEAYAWRPELGSLPDEADARKPSEFSFPRSAVSVQRSELGLSAAGSNAWAVAGERSVTGSPLLAADPHLFVRLPAVWYEIHLQGGDYHVAGASLPGLPGVFIGHNERVAWGPTVAYADQMDFYVEKVDPADPRRYQFEAGWETARVVREEIRVRGRPKPEVEEVRITRHGPILTPTALLPGEPRMLALRSVALSDELAAVQGAALWMNRAGSWTEFRAALERWWSPALTFVYADVEGNIATQVAGRVPARGRGRGLAPAPGWLADYEWKGWVPFDALPSQLNPARGWVASANQDPVGPDYPHFLGCEWEDAGRYERIEELLGARARHSALDFRAMQADVYSRHAERLVAKFLRPAASSPDQRLAQELLARWNCRMEPVSCEAAVFQVARQRLVERLFSAELGEDLSLLLGGGLGPAVAPTLGLANRVSDILLQELERRAREEVEDHLLAALSEAVALLRERLGARPEDWVWGRLHSLSFQHALSSRKPLDRLFNLGPYPLGGDGSTLYRSTIYPPGSFQANGWIGSYRQVLDLADWDNSLSVLAPGQSGHRLSRHYADQAHLWRTVTYHPAPFTRKAVEVHASRRLKLAPEP